MRKSLDLEASVTPERRHRMTIGSLALVLFAVIAASGGQLMLKHGMQVATARTRGGGSLVIAAATTPWVLLGLLVFAVSAVVWLAALSRVPLSLAYPFNALGYLVILTASIVAARACQPADLGRHCPCCVGSRHRGAVEALASRRPGASAASALHT